ncbi:MAG TPA: HAMP domain-containing sensor histidine kinase [Methyloceanibacter sp.]
MRSSQKPSASLWLRLIVGLVSVSLLAVGAASAALYVRFKAKNLEFREQTLRNQAGVIADYLKTAAAAPVQLPAEITEAFQANHGRYAIVDRYGNLLAASPGVTAPLAAIGEPRGLFVLQPDQEQQPFFGLSVKTPFGDDPVWVQVAFHAGNIVYDSVLEEFVQDIAWIWIPFVVVLLLVNLLVARIGLMPLRMAAKQAAAIGPAAVSTRLTEGGLPRDVHALVSAVNRGLDRLETAFDAQRRFIADAAHELRTPVAVLKAHMGILEKFDGHAALVDEIGSLERLVNQLLDIARLDVLQLEDHAVADLTQVATEVASHLGPAAIDAERSIEVIAPDEPVRIRGARDYLFRALRNIVENALRHTPEGTTVSIVVEAEPPSLNVIDHGPGVRADQRHAIFGRFWQGGRDQTGGAGLGLDIAARTVVAHGGVISVGDAPEGGAVFTMQFDSIETATPEAKLPIRQQPLGPQLSQ